MKLLVDMNLSPLWIPFLQQHGFEAVHWSQVGSPAAPDTEIMDYAVASESIIFTHDLDFGRMLALERSGAPSVVQVRAQNILPFEIGDLVVKALTASRQHLVDGALVTIDPIQHRIRLLPI